MFRYTLQNICLLTILLQLLCAHVSCSTKCKDFISELKLLALLKIRQKTRRAFNHEFGLKDMASVCGPFANYMRQTTKIGEYVYKYVCMYT
jgi:hypothetical protein